uniref:mRNA (guanine-N(7))-methyltransferase n=1 Tax=viral metagenome TaxID=1070528 RepID=A0A6C0ICD0_9ZZZZ
MSKPQYPRVSNNDSSTLPQKQEVTQLFENIVSAYLRSNPSISGAKYQTRKVPEFEIRFGTGRNNLSRNISKIEYDNVVKAIYSAGFETENGNHDGYSILRIQNEYYERSINMHKISNIRAEIAGVDLIQEYCRTNNLQKILDMSSTTDAIADKIKFTQKQTARSDGEASDYIKPVDFPDFGFRVSYQNETYHSARSDLARKIITDWTNSKKTFRYLNRVRFSHPTIPIFVDISIVKKSRSTNYGVPVPQYTIQDSGVLTNIETYEIELEVDNQRMQGVSKESLLKTLRKTIRMVLGAIQETKFPIGFSEMKQVMKGYLSLIHSENSSKTEQRPGPDIVTPEFIDSILERRDLSVFLPKYFIGPSSTTLQTENIVSLEVASTSNIPNIRNNYTVTDKADGERRLLYIAENGRVYMISTNMNIIFTGVMVTRNPSTEGKNEDLYNTLIDGEFIVRDKHGDIMNLFMAFDIYFVKGVNVRRDGFYPLTLEERTRGNFRFIYLEKYMQLLKLRSIMDSSESTKQPQERSCGFEIQKKNFFVASEGDKIFEACNSIISNIESGMYPYNTDGLIFTPSSTGVGADRIGVSGKARKETWEHSFKWKPPEYNTIDFLVSIKKDKRDQDEIKYMYMDGRNLQDDSKNIIAYKTLILKCGYDPKRHGYLNPYNDVLQNRVSSGTAEGGMDPEKSETYRPVPFQPTNPYDPNACFCNVVLQDTGDMFGKGTEGGILLSEEKEYFEENMIVEFRYDPTREGAWKWIPLRVRYDKTTELRSGHRNYGNAYHTANSNWHSIHNPVSQYMITTGDNIPEVSFTQNDVYYNRKTRETNTQGLRNFHNLYVKRRLILAVSNPGNRLLDLACGKGGDLSKWRLGGLKFVLGIDVNRDNITNQIDGACSRYLSDYKKYGDNMPQCLFFTGDSGKNIRTTGDAFASQKERDYVHAIFGQGAKNPNDLPPGVFKAYGIGEDGFDVTSIQFAIHYLFSDEVTLHHLLRNVSDCTHVGGYFIGTTYDGATVFEKLRNKQKGESWTIMRNGNKMAEIIKQYNDDVFPEDEHSIGMQIDVYQDSINKVFPEFLVNFKYLIQLMDQYGFSLITNDQASKLGLSTGSGMFEELYRRMEYEIQNRHIQKEEYGVASEMSPEEKQISFLNRFFVFKKTHTVNTENLYKIIRNRSTIRASESEKSITQPTTTIIKTKKLKQKITIDCPNSSGSEEATRNVSPLPNSSGDLRSPSELVEQRLQGTEAPLPDVAPKEFIIKVARPRPNISGNR